MTSLHRTALPFLLLLLLSIGACGRSAAAVPVEHPSAPPTDAAAPGHPGTFRIEAFPPPSSEDVPRGHDRSQLAPGFANENFGITLMHIRLQHVEGEKPSQDDLFYGMTKGMVEALGDPHSEFYTPAEAEKYLRRVSNSIAGIGAQLDKDDNGFLIVQTIKGSPAEKVGLMKGDRILEVDGDSVDGLQSEALVEKVRGEPGTTVTLVIYRKGEPEPRKVPVVRAVVKGPPPVEYSIVTNGKKRIMVIHFGAFLGTAGDAFHEAAVQAVTKSVDGLIMDVRGNPGGELQMAGELICHWKNDKPVVYVEQRGPLTMPMECEPGLPILANMPTVVLVDGYSASASEVLTGALQDFGKAHVIGEKTYGKGCGQSLFDDYPDGSILKLTTFYWLTPNKRRINKVGLTPDETVIDALEDLKNGKDAQMDRALEYLSTGK